jgi:hypothetical protein
MTASVCRALQPSELALPIEQDAKLLLAIRPSRSSGRNKASVRRDVEIVRA